MTKRGPLERAARIPPDRSPGARTVSTQVEAIKLAAIEAASDQGQARVLWSHSIELCGEQNHALPTFLRFLLRDGLISTDQFYPLRDQANALGGW